MKSLKKHLRTVSFYNLQSQILNQYTGCLNVGMYGYRVSLGITGFSISVQGLDIRTKGGVSVFVLYG